MEAEFGAARVLPALAAQLERPVTANAELVLALGAGEVHAAALDTDTELYHL